MENRKSNQPEPIELNSSSVAEELTREKYGDETSKELEQHIDVDVQKILESFVLEDICSHLLRRAHFFAEELFSKEFSDESMTPRKKAALIIIYQNPGQSQKALAEKLHMDHNTVAEMVSRLVTENLLLRLDAKKDKRAYQLFLTPLAAKVLNRIMPRDLQLEKKILETLPEEYRPIFMKCLRIIALSKQ